MRAWNLLVEELELVDKIASGFRNNLCFAKESKSIKRVHVGDTVIIHNYSGEHHQVVKKVSKKEMVRAKRSEDEEESPAICIWFD